MEVLLFHLPTAVNMPIGTQSFNQEPPCSNGKTMGTARPPWESKHKIDGNRSPTLCSPRNMACLRDEFWFTFSTWVCLKAESGRFDSHKRDAPFLTHFHARIFVHGVIDGFNYSLNHLQGCKLAFPRKRTASSTTILWFALLVSKFTDYTF